MHTAVIVAHAFAEKKQSQPVPSLEATQSYSVRELIYCCVFGGEFSTALMQ